MIDYNINKKSEVRVALTLYLIKYIYKKIERQREER